MEVLEEFNPAEVWYKLMRAVRYHLLMAHVFHKHRGFMFADCFADCHMKMARQCYDMARRIKQ